MIRLLIRLCCPRRALHWGYSQPLTRPWRPPSRWRLTIPLDGEMVTYTPGLEWPVWVGHVEEGATSTGLPHTEAHP